MGIKTRRWNDPADPGDGLRVLICRYRPRGVSKADKTWDVWIKELGPSVQLHADFYGKAGRPPIDEETYRTRYLAEMQAQRALIESLGRMVAAGEPVTLLCSSACTDAAKCHRTLLRDLILRAVSRT